MHDSIKTICVVVLAVGAFVAAFAWSDDRPTIPVWLCRLGSVAAILSALALYLKLHFKPPKSFSKPFRRDKVPDLLRKHFRNYYNCGGFCFMFGSDPNSDSPHVRMWFQNQYERPCRATVYLTPIRHFWERRPQVQKIEVPVTCEGGDFLVITVPIVTGAEMAGKKVICNVSADVGYPEKRGKRLMFHEGMQVGSSPLLPLNLLGPLLGVFVWSTPARVKLQLPHTIEHPHPGDEPSAGNLYWTAGD